MQSARGDTKPKTGRGDYERKTRILVGVAPNRRSRLSRTSGGHGDDDKRLMLHELQTVYRHDRMGLNKYIIGRYNGCKPLETRTMKNC